MKTATIPSVRVEPDFRAEVEAVLADGETLSEFVEASVRVASSGAVSRESSSRVVCAPVTRRGEPATM